MITEEYKNAQRSLNQLAMGNLIAVAKINVKPETRPETEFEFESVKLFESHAIVQNRYAQKCLQDTAMNAIAYPIECGELA